jgi:hypothetical protein
MQSDHRVSRVSRSLDSHRSVSVGRLPPERPGCDSEAGELPRRHQSRGLGRGHAAHQRSVWRLLKTVPTRTYVLAAYLERLRTTLQGMANKAGSDQSRTNRVGTRRSMAAGARIVTTRRTRSQAVDRTSRTVRTAVLARAEARGLLEHPSKRGGIVVPSITSDLIDRVARRLEQTLPMLNTGVP